MKVHVCTTCGSPRVFCDAYQSLNDPDNVRVFDDTYCDDCAGETTTEVVEVPDDFDIETDTYEVKNGTTAG